MLKYNKKSRTSTSATCGRFVIGTIYSSIQRGYSRFVILRSNYKVLGVIVLFCCWYLFMYFNYIDHSTTSQAMLLYYLNNPNANLNNGSRSIKSIEYDNIELVNAFDNVPEHIMTVSDIEQYMMIHNINTTTTPIVYFITPTIRTYTQYLDLIRLSQTLMNDKAIYWIIIEDRTNCTQRIRNLLNRSGILYAHTAALTPKETSKRWVGSVPKGVVQRNRGLEIVESLTQHHHQQQQQHQYDNTTTTTITSTTNQHGIVYFGDDDNAYDIRLFNEIRKLQIGHVGVFGVAYTGGGKYERCIVNPITGTVQQLVTTWPGPLLQQILYEPYTRYMNYIHRTKKKNSSTSTTNPYKRIFPVDMGGFVISTKLINQYHPRFRNDWVSGFLETKLIEQLNLTSIHQLQPLLNNCTLMYVWHVKTHVSKHSPVHTDVHYETIQNLI